MAKQKEFLTIQHILEVRLKRRYLKFLDKKGKLLTELLTALELDEFRIGIDRIELVTDDRRIMYFMSSGNFGLQIDNSETFDEFKNESQKLAVNIKKIKDFQPELLRLGTKSSIYYHRKGCGFNEIKEMFERKLLPKVSELEKLLGGKQIDIGLPVHFSSDKANFNIVSGPMKKDQAINESFRKNESLYKSLPDSGLFFAIDLFQLAPTQINYDELEDKIIENIELIDKKFNSFKNWLFKES